MVELKNEGLESYHGFFPFLNFIFRWNASRSHNVWIFKALCSYGL